MSAIFGNIDGATGRELSAADLERQEQQSFDQYNREGESEGGDEPPARSRADDDDAGGDDRQRVNRIPVGRPDDEDAAEEIALRAEERLTKKAKTFSGDMNDRDLQYGQFTDDGGEAPIGTKNRDGVNQDAPAGDEQRQQADQRHKVRVNHQDLELTTEELYAAAQKTLAGEQFFEQAKQHLEEAKRIAAEIKAGVRPPETAEERAKAEEGLTDEEKVARAKFAEALAYGTPEEQEAAVREREDFIVSKAMAKVREETHFNNTAEWLKRDVNLGEQYVIESYPDLIEKPSLRDATVKRATEMTALVMANMVENLSPEQQAAFARGSVTPDSLRALANNPPGVKDMMVKLHALGYGQFNNLPPMSRILKVAADSVASELGIPARSGQQGNRSDGDPRQHTSSRPEPSGRVQISPERMARRETTTPQPKRSQASGGRQADGPISQDRFHKEFMEEARETRGIPLRRR